MVKKSKYSNPIYILIRQLCLSKESELISCTKKKSSISWEHLNNSWTTKLCLPRISQLNRAKPRPRLVCLSILQRTRFWPILQIVRIRQIRVVIIKSKLSNVIIKICAAELFPKMRKEQATKTQKRWRIAVASRSNAWMWNLQKL